MIHKSIKSRLAYLGMTVSELAIKVGISRQAMYNYFRVPGRMPLEVAWRIEKILGWERGTIGGMER